MLFPAYGRDYRSLKAAQADFDAGKDFMVAGEDSRYIDGAANKADLEFYTGRIFVCYARHGKIGELRHGAV